MKNCEAMTVNGCQCRREGTHFVISDTPAGLREFLVCREHCRQAARFDIFRPAPGIEGQKIGGPARLADQAGPHSATINPKEASHAEYPKRTRKQTD